MLHRFAYIVTAQSKSIAALTVDDLIRAPVWRYVRADQAGEIALRPVTKVPVANLGETVLGTQVRLANGSLRWALLGNVEPINARMTMHFLTLSLERDGTWFHLARYHDFDYAERGPDALASFLNLPLEDIFPIVYDLRHLALGDPAVLAGAVPQTPRERLSREAVIALSLA